MDFPVVQGAVDERLVSGIGTEANRFTRNSRGARQISSGHVAPAFGSPRGVAAFVRFVDGMSIPPSS